MKTASLLSETEDGLYSNAEPLLNEIIEALEARNITLTEAEERTVLKLINSAHFRTAAQIMSEDENKITKDTDAVTILLQTVGMIAFYLYTSYVTVTLREDTNENTANTLTTNTGHNKRATTTKTRLIIGLNEGDKGITDYEDGICSNDQKDHERMKKFLLDADKEKRSQFILMVAMLHGGVIPKELIEKLCELSFFKYLFSLFSNERTFKLLECWRKNKK